MMEKLAVMSLPNHPAYPEPVEGDAPNPYPQIRIRVKVHQMLNHLAKTQVDRLAG